MPPLDPAEALETSMIHSIAGHLQDGKLKRRRPFRDPHHSASLPSLVVRNNAIWRTDPRYRELGGTILRIGSILPDRLEPEATPVRVRRVVYGSAVFLQAAQSQLVHSRSIVMAFGPLSEQQASHCSLRRPPRPRIRRSAAAKTR